MASKIHLSPLSFNLLSANPMCSWCHVAVCNTCLILTVPWVGLQFVILAYSGHINIPFDALGLSLVFECVITLCD